MIDKLEMQKALITYNFLSEIAETKRSQEQQDKFDAARTFIMEHYIEYFEEYNKQTFERILFEGKAVLGMEKSLDSPRAPGLDRSIDVLTHEETNIPRLGGFITDPEIDIFLSKAYAAHRSLAAELEGIEPIYKRWLSELKEAEKRFKAVCNFKSEFKSEALTAVVMPDDVMDMVRSVGERVAQIKLRVEAWDVVYERISRLITQRTSGIYERGTQAPSPYGDKMPQGPAISTHSTASMAGRYSKKA